MKKLGGTIILLVFCLALFPDSAAAETTDLKEKAIQSLHAGNYQAAIETCQRQLEVDPENYDFSFILSRAYAYSKQREKALVLLNRMLEIYPQNLDLLLFRSRVKAWEGEYEEADAGFLQVLAVEPENKEALIGRAEIASWEREFSDAKKKYEKILLLDPDDPEVLFRIGRVYQWEGNYAKARQYYEKASRRDPENTEYRSALKNAFPRFMNKFEARYQYQNQSFNDERGHYLDHQFLLSMNVSPDIGAVHLKYSQTRRYGVQDSQIGLELYPHLWQKAYGFIDLNYSSRAVYYPRTSVRAEVYQTFLRAAEISLGYRQMNFKNETVPVYLGSVGYYTGNYYPFLRWYYTPEDKGANFSWSMNVRRYFTKDSYLALGFGAGSRPFDIITTEDARIQKSWILSAEWDWYFLEKIHVKILFTHRNENDGLTRNTLFVATGYRW